MCCSRDQVSYPNYVVPSCTRNLPAAELSLLCSASQIFPLFSAQSFFFLMPAIFFYTQVTGLLWHCSSDTSYLNGAVTERLRMHPNNFELQRRTQLETCVLCWVRWIHQLNSTALLCRSIFLKRQRVLIEDDKFRDKIPFGMLQTVLHPVAH